MLQQVAAFGISINKLGPTRPQPAHKCQPTVRNSEQSKSDFVAARSIRQTHGRPPGTRQAFSAGFFRDLAEVWWRVELQCCIPPRRSRRRSYRLGCGCPWTRIFSRRGHSVVAARAFNRRVRSPRTIREPGRVHPPSPHRAGLAPIPANLPGCANSGSGVRTVEPDQDSVLTPVMPFASIS